MVVADLVQRSLPERGAGDRAVAERELHGLEWASISGVICSCALWNVFFRRRMTSAFAIAPWWTASVLVPLALSMKRWVMPATSTSWSHR